MRGNRVGRRSDAVRPQDTAGRSFRPLVRIGVLGGMVAAGWLILAILGGPSASAAPAGSAAANSGTASTPNLGSSGGLTGLTALLGNTMESNASNTGLQDVVGTVAELVGTTLTGQHGATAPTINSTPSTTTINESTGHDNGLAQTVLGRAEPLLDSPEQPLKNASGEDLTTLATTAPASSSQASATGRRSSLDRVDRSGDHPTTSVTAHVMSSNSATQKSAPKTETRVVNSTSMKMTVGALQESSIAPIVQDSTADSATSFVIQQYSSTATPATDGGLLGLGLLADQDGPLGRVAGPILSPVTKVAAPVTNALGGRSSQPSTRCVHRSTPWPDRRCSQWRR